MNAVLGIPHWVVGLPVGPLSLISDPGTGRVVHTHVTPNRMRYRSTGGDALQMGSKV